MNLRRITGARFVCRAPSKSGQDVELRVTGMTLAHVFWWHSHVQPIFFLPYFFRIPAVLYLGGWFVIQFFQGTMTIGAQDVGGVAFWAHIGGFVAGIALFGLFLRPKGERRPLQPDEGALESAWWQRVRES